MKIFFSTMGIALAILLTASLISNTMVMQSINAQFAPSSTGTAPSSTGTAPSSTGTAPSSTGTSTTSSLSPSTQTKTAPSSTGTQAVAALTPQCIAAQNVYKTAKTNFDAALKAFLTNPGNPTIFNNYMKALNAWVAAQNALSAIPNCPKPV